jgi:hypothetical protein
MFRAVLASLVFLLPLHAEQQTPQAIATEIIGPLLDPAKEDTLKGPRPINARTYRLLYWVEMARRAGGDVSGILDTAQQLARYHGSPRAKADALAIIGNRDKLEALGCFDAAGMAELRRGHGPTITNGPDAGRGVEPGHIFPVSITPELAAQLFNLQAISDRENLAKTAKIGRREIGLARV